MRSTVALFASLEFIDSSNLSTLFSGTVVINKLNLDDNTTSSMYDLDTNGSAQKHIFGKLVQLII